MSNTLIFDNFSTIRNTTVESSSSSEEEDQRDDKLDKLYEFIGAPNPLPEEKKTYSSDVKTAYKLNFTQLPSALYSASTTDHSMFENINKIEDEIAQTLYNMKNPEKESEKPIQPINSTKTLFNVYPRSDSRLVYMKYKDQGDWELNLKGYANYLINISNLIRNKEVKIQYLSRNVVNVPPVINPRPNALHFNSNFESGNLYAAFKISEFEYDLILQNDINSRGHTQWFFFSIGNAVKGRTIKFNMVNLLKPESLFNEGMKPLVFSTKDNESRGDGWKRAGFDISYTRNNIQKEGGCNKSYYTLSFSYTFKEDDDIVYFAHCFPYTYTDLKAFLTKICADPARKMYIVRKTLCYTLAQNECEYLSITSPYNLENVDKRCGIVITARQHPGESLSSYMMEGFIEWITSEDPEAQYLRRYCVFKVVPMLNPDGVIHGNYRSSLCGRDLNRIWNKASPLLHPTIYHTKELIRKLQTRRRLHLICDLHGHSRKKNAFFYGNATEANPYKARMFPLIMSKVSKYVTFEDCRFAVQRSKESTARIALWREHKSENIFTLEASFFGYNQGGEIVHFTKEDYRKLGADLGKAIFIQLKQMNLENLKTSAVQTTGVYGDAQEASIPKTKPAAKDLASRRRSMSMQMNDEEGENEEKGKKVFLEDQIKPTVPLRTSELMNSNNLLQELKANKKLIEMGNKDDSGSDTDLTDEDISNKELQKVLPVKSGKLKKKKTKDGKKKTGSAAQTKRDEEKEKKEQAVKVDGATNTTLGANNKLKQELAANALIKPKTMKKFRVVTRDSATQQRLYSAGTGKDVANPLEMVSIGVQTDDCGVWDYEQEVGPGEKGILYPFPKAFGRSKSPQATSSARGRILFIQGEKTGVDISSGIDINYKLGKNQISRSILAKLNPKMLTTTNANNNQNVGFNQQNADQRREYQGFVGHIKKLGSIQISNQEVRAKMSVVKQTEIEGKGGNNKEMNAAYYMKYKEIENKVNANRPDSFNTIERTDETRNNYRKSAHASSLENSEKKHTNSLRNLENNDPLSEERDHIPGASSSNQRIFNFNNNNKPRLNSKDKPPVPLPRLLPMISKRIDNNKEPLTTDVSSFINNTRKMVNGEEFADDSFAKAKLLKFTGGQQKGGSCITSGRESIDLNAGEKSKERAGAAELFRENYGQSRMSDYPGSSVAKERPKSPKKRSSAKLERIVSTDVKVNLERKALIGAFNIVSPAHAGGRRSQNSVLKKF